MALTESISAMSARTPALNMFRRDARLGNKTLSSFALPILDDGSSCSLNMLNLAERLGMSRLVRKSSDEGSAEDKSSSGFGACWPFFPFLVAFEDSAGTAGASAWPHDFPPVSAASLFFFFVRKRFMVAARPQSVRPERIYGLMFGVTGRKRVVLTRQWRMIGNDRRGSMLCTPIGERNAQNPTSTKPSSVPTPERNRVIRTVNAQRVASEQFPDTPNRPYEAQTQTGEASEESGGAFIYDQRRRRLVTA